MDKFNPIILAYYLPQYHPFPQNDEWWGKGFTEWTNVGKAKPLFKGHYQPKVPTELGYYDLRLPEVRQQQVDLAKAAGVTGFCYWHYWFGNKRQLLNEIIDDVIESGKPDFPFCFGWANESWKAKQWNKDGTGDKMLMEQIYGGEQDYREHFEYALKAFKDKRYVKIDNKPVFLIYRPDLVPADFVPYWNKLAKDAGFDGMYFIGRINATNISKEACEKKNIHNFTCERWASGYQNNSIARKIVIRLQSKLKHVRVAVPYKACIPFFTDEVEDIKENFIPCLIPNWDHSPRSKRGALVLENPEPKYFYQHAKHVLELVKKKKNQLVFLKSWNEWGEGNYMEPDIKYGKGYIDALARAINDVKYLDK